MVYRLELTYCEINDSLDVKYPFGSTKGYTLKPGCFEISDINLMLKFLFLKQIKVNITTDDLRSKSNLKNNQTSIFTKNLFFYTKLGFTRSHSEVLDDIDGFIQLIPGSYRSDRPINITGIDKFH